MNKRRPLSARLVNVDVEGDAVTLLESLLILMRVQAKKLDKVPATRDEVVGAIIASYCFSHQSDIMEALTDEAQRQAFDIAIRRHIVRSQLPRSHHAAPRRPDPRLPEVSDGGPAAGAPGGDSSAPAAAADRDAAAK
jgi:hypothetical protein